MIIHPMGYTLTQALPWEHTVYAEIDLKEVYKVREELPTLRHALIRKNLYLEILRQL